MQTPTLQEFEQLVSQGRTIPVYREIHADLVTPVSAFHALDDGRHTFLLESVEGGEKWGRYSFVGTAPRAIIRVIANTITIEDRNGETTSHETDDPLAFLVKFVEDQKAVTLPDLPRFCGGLVGYLGYDMVRHVEDLPDIAIQSHSYPDACMLLTDVMVVFDSRRQSLFVISHARVDPEDDPAEAYREACGRVDEIVTRLQTGPKAPWAEDILPEDDVINEVDDESMTTSEFEQAVDKARQYVESGDIIQVVLSRRLSTPAKGLDAFHVYRMLRAINPSPYLYFFRLPEVHIAGSSPEVLVRLTHGTVEVRPIAGTRKRGRNPQEDMELAADLRSDPKEVAEHVMLLDLGRNDVGRIAQTGSVEVIDQMVTEYYSHVMHLVSGVQGTVREDVHADQVIRATFPAGTLSGAPKVRAMEIIEELEPIRRGIYGGAVGYIDFGGNMDLCIAIRTLVASDDHFHVQAGAGIVYDSVPEREANETNIKAQAVLRSIAMARAAFPPSPGENT